MKQLPLVKVLAVALLLSGCGAENPLQRGESSGATPPDNSSPCGAKIVSFNSLAKTAQDDCPPTASFSAAVKPALQRCSGCHASGAGGWTYDNGPQAYTQTLGQLDQDDAATSPLLLKAINQSSHGGGPQFTSTSAEYADILAWIAAGAPDN
jgi:mono/diheme cytochrome c family protein